MNQNLAKYSLRFRLVEIVIVALSFGSTGSVWANSCLLERADAERLEGRVGKLDMLSIGKVVVSPCEGRVTSADALILHSRGGGITQLTLVKAGLDLREAIARPLQDIAQPGGLLGSFWTSLTAPRPTRPGSKRFDDAQGLAMGGQVLAGPALWIPLARFGWDPVAPVRVAAGKRIVTLSPSAGRVLIPADVLTVGNASMLQGERNASLEIIGLESLDGLKAQLEDIANSATDEPMRWLRQTVLFFEWGLILNAADADTRMAK